MKPKQSARNTNHINVEEIAKSAVTALIKSVEKLFVEVFWKYFATIDFYSFLFIFVDFSLEGGHWEKLVLSLDNKLQIKIKNKNKNKNTKLEMVSNLDDVS